MSLCEKKKDSGFYVSGSICKKAEIVVCDLRIAFQKRTNYNLNFKSGTTLTLCCTNGICIIRTTIMSCTSSLIFVCVVVVVAKKKRVGQKKLFEISKLKTMHRWLGIGSIE